MQNKITILMAQINPKVGDIDYNCKKIIDVIEKNQSHHDLILFPELALIGYPPEDLLFRKELHQQAHEKFNQIQNAVKNCHVLIGHSYSENEKIYNSASLLFEGKNLLTYHKQNLPNYEIFDEARYFSKGPRHPAIFKLKGHTFGVCICEDAWQPGPVEDLIDAGASTILSINASPFEETKYQRRIDLLKHYANKGISWAYVNQIGGQDDLLFDGQSLAMDNTGKIVARAQDFAEELLTIEINDHQLSGPITALKSKPELLYEALVCGTREYVNKNNFPGVLLGLSGGIDSALTLAIAVDALGAERVHAVLMPSQYTSSMSIEDANQQLKNLNVKSSNLSIEPAFATLLETLKTDFLGTSTDITEENLQARIRGILLMALSNKKGYMVLTTSNKSEAAVGYATLYGDMCGGFAVLKDVLKTQVYQLAHYRNSISKIIPDRVIHRPPSAELKLNQTDQDSLPDYETLDAILVAYIENKLTIKDIIQQGYSEKDVYQIINLIKKNEYKRRQSAPGIKVSRTAFGKDWRYPITNGFKEN